MDGSLIWSFFEFVWSCFTLATYVSMFVTSGTFLYSVYLNGMSSTRITIDIEDSGDKISWDVRYNKESIKNDYYIQFTDGNIRVLKGKKAQPSTMPLMQIPIQDIPPPRRVRG